MPGVDSKQEMHEPPVNNSENQLRHERSFSLCDDDFDFARQSMAKKYRSYFDGDMEQSAYLGLLEAAADFIADGPAEFHSFAYWRINGSVYDESLKKINLSKREYVKIRNWQITEERLAQELQRWPSWREVAGELNLTDKEAEDIIRYMSSSRMLSLDQPLVPGGKDVSSRTKSVEEVLDDPFAPTEEEIIEELDRPREIDLIMSKIERLVPTQKSVILGHFMGGVAIADMARQEGVTFQAVNQRKNIALGHLARQLAAAA